jgi:integrase/recombinase XerD
MGKMGRRSGARRRFRLSTVKREYEQYLIRERGLSRSTRTRYCWTVERFLGEVLPGDSLGVGALHADNISRFVLRGARRISGRAMQIETTALRSFLRFLFLRGKIPTDLARSVPTVADRSRSTLPRYLPADQVEHLLESCDRESAMGRRDYAILLLLARLGLRGQEVVRLTLEDVDWRAGEIVVRGKGQVVHRLPLPHEVGRALATYLRRDRRTDARSIFVRMRNPKTGFKDGTSINEIVHKALKRSRLEMPAKGIGAHVLRHSLATAMLRRGASLNEIGQVLRHRSANTTAIYAKVDIEGLRSIARPWPMESRP